jgi:aromatic ring-opening dioxygenase LigB subunit
MLKDYLVPHPPLIVKGVGDGFEIPSTRAAYEEIGREICDYNPDVAVIISPHSILYADYFHISPGKSAYGDFGRFNSPQIKFDVEYDSLLSNTITEFAEAENIRAGFLGERDSKLDHGTMVPLVFTNVRKLFAIPPEVAENAAECGLRSIMIMCGIFDGLNISSDVLSYEAPFGVGYMCAKFTIVK